MSTRDKLIERFCQLPNDFTFDELCRLFRLFGYKCDSKGSTSGSRIAFVKGDDKFYFHRPHPGNIMRMGVLRSLYKLFKQRKLI